MPIAERSPLPSSSMSAVDAPRALPCPSGSLDRSALATSSTNETTGTAAWRTLHTRRPFDSTDLSIDGKREGTSGARLGQPRPVDPGGRHDTRRAGAESGIARLVRPRGTMLSVTRGARRT